MNEKVRKYIKYSSYTIALVSIVAIGMSSSWVTAIGVFGLLWANNISLKIR